MNLESLLYAFEMRAQFDDVEYLKKVSKKFSKAYQVSLFKRDLFKNEKLKKMFQLQADVYEMVPDMIDGMITEILNNQGKHN